MCTNRVLSRKFCLGRKLRTLSMDHMALQREGAEGNVSISSCVERKANGVTGELFFREGGAPPPPLDRTLTS